MSVQENRTEVNDTLWVLTKLRDSVCAVNSAYVESILLLEQDITSLPDSDRVNIGIISFRGDIIPVVDMRCFLGMESQEQEQEGFDLMLEQRKQDHIRWVGELRRCIEENDIFRLATDPHQCAFGKWYDHYKPTNHTVAFHLKKIDEPHKNLHKTALEAFSCKQDCAHCQRKNCLRTELNKATDIYMPEVIKLLDEAKAVFRASYRKMVVVLSDGVSSCGVLVDEVLSAEVLPTMTENGQAGETGELPLVSHIAQRRDAAGQVLVLNLDRIFAAHP